MGTRKSRDILGSDGDDELVGTRRGDRIEGLAGDDVLIGGPGSDRLLGGPGDDLLVAADLEGGAADNGRKDRNLLDGGEGDDRLVGGDGRDLLLGGLGQDVLVGLGGDDLLLGEEGADLFAYAYVEPEGEAAQGGSDVVLDLDPGEDSLALWLGLPGDGLDEAAVRELLDGNGDGLLGTGDLLVDHTEIDGLASLRIDIGGLAEIARGGTPPDVLTPHHLVLAGVDALAIDQVAISLLA